MQYINNYEKVDQSFKTLNAKNAKFKSWLKVRNLKDKDIFSFRFNLTKKLLIRKWKEIQNYKN